MPYTMQKAANIPQNCLPAICQSQAVNTASTQPARSSLLQISSFHSAYAVYTKPSERMGFFVCVFVSSNQSAYHLKATDFQLSVGFSTLLKNGRHQIHGLVHHMLHKNYWLLWSAVDYTLIMRGISISKKLDISHWAGAARSVLRLGNTNGKHSENGSDLLVKTIFIFSTSKWHISNPLFTSFPLGGCKGQCTCMPYHREYQQRAENSQIF